MIQRILGKPSKYGIIILFDLLLIIFMLIIKPHYVKISPEEWSGYLNREAENIESDIQNYFDTRIDLISNELIEIKKELKANLQKDSNFYFNENLKKFESNSDVAIYKEDELIAWTTGNNHFVTLPNLINFLYGEIHFRKTKLYQNLTVMDTIRIGSGNYRIIVNLPIEKYYRLQAQIDKNISTANYFNEKYFTSFTFKYNADAELARDGRLSSFPIYNNFKNKIGAVTFEKPFKEIEENKRSKEFEDIFSILIFIFFLTFGFANREKTKNKFSGFSYFLFFAIYMVLLRVLLFYFKIPSRYFNNWLTDSAYFSSSFAFGIVSTPMHFFITLVFLLLITMKGFLFFRNYLVEKDLGKLFINKEKWKIILLKLLISIVFLLLLRGYASSIRNVIFDSSILYFKTNNLIPEAPILFLQFSVLIFSLSFFLVSIILVFLLVGKPDKGSALKSYVIYLIILELLGYIFDYVQIDPQGTDFIRIIFILGAFVFTYRLLYYPVSRINRYLSYLFFISFISINLLIHYNYLLERESLKTSAINFTRPDINLSKFLLRETMVEAKETIKKEGFLESEQIDFDALVFAIWSRSPLQREALSSEILIVDSNEKILGRYAFIFKEKDVEKIRNKNKFLFDNEITEMAVFESNGEHPYVKAVSPIYFKDGSIGYLIAAVNYGLNKALFANKAEFLTEQLSFINSPVKLKDLLIFDFQKNKLINFYGNFYPPYQLQQQIIKGSFEGDYDKWMKLKVNNNSYFAYVIKYDDENEKILSVALPEKLFTKDLFDFFKLFFIHSFFIFLTIIVYSIYKFKEFLEIKSAFRTKLFVSFFIIAIVPLIFLAFYFRNLTENRNQEASFYKLRKRAVRVDKLLKLNDISSVPKFVRVCNKIKENVGIDFSIYHEQKLFYSTQTEHYTSGLFSLYLNPIAYQNTKFKGFNEFVNNEKLLNLSYNVFYYKTNLNGIDYVISVNDIFNDFLLPMSASEVDMFLFGSYSLAVILVLIISTIIANQISSPINKLTSATRAVAKGNLELKIDYKTKGEIKELIDGFNLMLDDIIKSRKELAEAERQNAWKEMARQVAHEIKNPLTPMKLAVQQLIIAYKDKSPKFDEIFEKVTSTFDEQVDTLRNITNEFSNFGRMPKSNLKQIELINLIKNVCNLYVDDRVEITFEYSESEVLIESDEDQLKRVLINLIRNAIQALAKKIKIKLIVENDIQIFISDNGTGIPTEIQNKIFDANFTTKLEGMGLGLNITKSYIEQLGGELKLYKSNKNGTTFQIKIPKQN